MQAHFSDEQILRWQTNWAKAKQKRANKQARPKDSLSTASNEQTSAPPLGLPFATWDPLADQVPIANDEKSEEGIESANEDKADEKLTESALLAPSVAETQKTHVLLSHEAPKGAPVATTTPEQKIERAMTPGRPQKSSCFASDLIQDFADDGCTFSMQTDVLFGFQGL